MKRVYFLALSALMLLASFGVPVGVLASDFVSNTGELYLFGQEQEFILDIVASNDDYFVRNGRSTQLGGNIILNEDGSPITISQIEELMSERTFALIDGNFARADEITAVLRTMGVGEISLEAIQDITGDDGYDISSFSVAPFFQQYIHFETVHSSIIIWCPQLGGWDDRGIMRIYARPIRGAAMWHEGAVTNVSRLNFSAGTVNIVRTWGEFGAGNLPVVGTAVSVLAALRDSIQGFAPNSHVNSLTVDYHFHAVETTVFYFRHNGSTWVQFGRTSDISYDIACQAVGVTIINGSSTPVRVNAIPIRGVVGHPQRRNITTIWNNAGGGMGLDTSMEQRTFFITDILGNDNPRMRVQMLRPDMPAMAR